MERRRGVILRGSPSRDQPLSADLVRTLCETLIDRMADLHALDYRAAGLGELGKPQGYVERQVDRLDPSDIKTPAPTMSPTSSAPQRGSPRTCRPSRPPRA